MPRIVVSNTTPIITFLAINKLDLLERMYEKVYIPSEVWKELEAGRAKDLYVDIQTFSWVEIRNIENNLLLQELENKLDKGEAEALCLATELNADLVLLDERLARKYASKMELNHTGSFGILLKAKENSLISSIKPLIEQAKENGIWLSDSLVEEILSLAKEI